LGIARPHATESFLAQLARHAWPGNVRELLNALERILVRTRSRILTAADADAALGPEPAPEFEPVAPSRAPEPLPGGRAAAATLREILSEREAGERREILDALRATRGNVNRAAERLHMARGTLRYRMHKYGIDEGA